MSIKDLKLNDIGKKLLLSFLFIVPIFFAAKINLGHSTLRVAQEQVFQLGIVILYAVVMLENIYLSLFLILAVILYVTNDYSGGNYLVNIFYGCLLYQISYRVIDSYNVRSVFQIILWLCALNIGWMICQNLGFDLIFFDLSQIKNPVMNNIGFMGLKCFMGMFFVLALPFMLYFNPWIGLSFLLPIFLSESSLSMTAAVVVLAIFFWWKLAGHSKRLLGVILLSLSLLGITYAFYDSKAGMMQDRVNLWKVVLKDAFKKPIAGWGLDSFRNIRANGEKDFNYFKNPQTNETVHGIYIPEMRKFMLPDSYKDKVSDPWDNAHNEYIQLFFEFGIIGIVLLVLLGRDIIRRFSIFEPEVFAIGLFFIAFAIVSFAHFPAHMARLGVFLPVMLGIYYKLTDEVLKGDELYGS